MLGGAVSAAPMLRLSNSVVTAQAAVGATASNQILQAGNLGDGILSPSASFSADITWLAVSVGGSQVCPAYFDGTCNPIHFMFSSAKLAAGNYTARVTVSDPNAIDSPQVVIVNLQVGPTPIVEYLAPGTTASVNIGFCGGISAPSACANGVTAGLEWLTLVVSSATCFLTEQAVFSVPVNMTLGTYNGNISISPPIGGNIPVTLHVVAPPVVVSTPSVSQISLQVAQNGPALTYPFLPAISLSNSR
jgi:hypothetical protein